MVPTLFALFASLLPAAVRSACPVVLAAVGEIHAEKSGVMNLGIEGMMMVGAFACFAATQVTGSMLLGLLAGMLAGALLAAFHALLVVRMGVDHIISGVMFGFMGVALADFLGRPFMGKQIPNLQPLNLGGISEIPLLGPLLFGQNPLVYLTAVLVLLSWVVFRYLRLGSMITAVGDNPRAADAAGLNVLRIRNLSVIYGGVLAGLAGSYMCLNYATTFVPNITAGRGWIAIALVIFSTWNPLLTALGGMLFGGIETLQFHLSLLKVQIPYHFLMMLPYIATIIVLVITGSGAIRGRPAAPQALGQTYKRE